MAEWFDALADSVDRAFGQSQMFQFGDGRLLFSPHAARLAACELPGVPGINSNLFWQHEDAIDPVKLEEAATSVLASLGGDRLWIAPEIAYFWTDLKAARKDPMQATIVQQSMDSGDYEIISDGDNHITMQAAMALHDYRKDKRINLQVSRTVRDAQPPLQLPGDLKCCSFAIENELEIAGGDDGAVAGAWDILQVPPVGTLICPTTTKATAREYYLPFGEKHVQTDDDSIRFFVDGQHRIKMGIAPEHTTGRMGYYQRHGESSSLIVRLFGSLPGEPYVDLPRDSNAMIGGDALQAYNDGGAFGGFGEMEYHDPAVIVGNGPTKRTGVSVTHVLAGPDAIVREYGQTLLGTAIRAID